MKAIQQPIAYAVEVEHGSDYYLRLSDLENLGGRIAIDFETTGTDIQRDFPLGLGVWAADANVYGYLRLNLHDYQRQLAEIREVMTTWHDDSWVMAHNLGFELGLLRLSDSELERLNWYDTQVMEHLLWEMGRKDLGATEKRRLGTETKAKLLEQGNLYGGISKVIQWPTELVADYCVNDCRLTYEIAKVQVPELKRQRLERIAAVQNRFVLTLHRMEREGVAADLYDVQTTKTRLLQLSNSGEQRLNQELKRLGLASINYGSPKQLHELIYKKLALPWPEMPPELANSPKAKMYNSTRTSQEFLERFDHPVVQLIAQLKKVSTVHGYLSSYQELGHVQGEHLVLYPSFNPTGTVTGRLSSSKPNMQQVSAKAVGQLLDPEGRGVYLRSIFVARPGRVLVSIDYKQMEVVKFALSCGEPEMVKMVKTGGDMHEQVAKLLFGVYTPENRKHVKNLNFGLLYGLGPAGLAMMMKVSQQEAQDLMAKYMARFARVRPWMSEIEQQLRRNNYVRYWSGRKRRIYNSDEFYKGVNAVVQGGSADILAVAANRVDDYLRAEGAGRIVGLIHDEVLMEVDEGLVSRVVPEVAEIMRVPDLLGTGFNTDVEIGPNWGEGMRPFLIKG